MPGFFYEERMEPNEIKEIIKQEKLIPILRTQTPGIVMNVAKAVADSGCRVLEYTMTIDGIIPEIGKVKDKYPDLIIGLGTVLNEKDANEAIQNGVDFIVSPILNYDIIDIVKKNGKMLILSGFTPTEIYNAYKAGSDIIKLFPASEVAPTFISKLKGPFPFIEIFPTGGLNLISAMQFLSYGAIAVGMGNTVFKNELIERRNFEEITSILKNAYRRIKNLEF